MFTQMCLNPKVIATLVAGGVIVLVFAPSAAASVLPFLILAACPLSMLLMGGMMLRSHESSDAAKSTPPLDSESAEEIARLGREVESLRLRLANGEAVANPRDRDESGPTAASGGRQ